MEIHSCRIRRVAEDPHEMRKDQRPESYAWISPRCWRWLAVGLLALVLLAAAIGKPVLKAYREWQNTRMLIEASESLKEGQHEKARQLALFLVRTGHETSQALPILLAAADHLGDPSRARYARAMLDALTEGDTRRIAAWRVMCRTAPAWQVMQAWSKLPDADIQSPAFVDELLDRMLRERMLAEGRWLISRQPGPLQASHLIRQLRFLAAADENPALLDVQVKLIDLAGERSDAIPALLEILDLIPQQRILPEMAKALLASRPEMATGNADASLARWSRLEMAADPSAAERIFTETRTRLNQSGPLHAARWCLWTGRPAEARNLLDEVEDQSSPEWHALARETAERLGDTAAWMELLESPVPGAFLPEVHCDLAHVATLAGDDARRKSAEAAALRDAVAWAGDDALVRLAERAEMRDMDDFAQRVWLEAIRRKTGPLPHAKRMEPLIRRLAVEKREDDLIALLDAYRYLEPENVVILIQHSYLSCVTSRSVPSLVARDLEKLEKQLPEMPPLLMTLAFARLLDGDSAGANAAAQAVEPAAIAEHPAYQAIRGLIHMALGNPEDAEPFLSTLNWDELLPSERQLFRKLLDSIVKEDGGK